MKSTIESAKRSALKKINRQARSDFRKQPKFFYLWSAPVFSDEDQREERKKHLQTIFKLNADLLKVTIE